MAEIKISEGCAWDDDGGEWKIETDCVVHSREPRCRHAQRMDDDPYCGSQWKYPAIVIAMNEGGHTGVCLLCIFDAARQNKKELPAFGGEKLIAITSGGDWNDASITHVVVEPQVNLKREERRHEDWWRKVLEEQASRGASQPAVKFMSFAEWLINCGAARPATDSEVEVYEKT